MALSIDSHLDAAHSRVMTESVTSGDRRKRGNVRVRGNSLQVRVYAGVDPVTGKPNYLTETIKGTDKAAHRLADKSHDSAASTGR